MKRIIGSITVIETCKCKNCGKTMDNDWFIPHMILRHPRRLLGAVKLTIKYKRLKKRRKGSDEHE